MDKAMQPLVSVIMPAHNAEPFIEKAIQSVIHQTYKNWELLIIDDASTDDTPYIIKNIEDLRIRYHRVNRIGSPAGVRNAGLKLAKGELLTFLDADDLYFPTAMETLTKVLIQKQNLTAVYGFAAYMDEMENPIRQDVILIPRPKQRKQEINYQLPPHYPMSWEKILTGHLSCLLPALMIRRSTFNRIGFFNEELCGPEDYEYYLRLYLDNFEGVACIPHYIYRYRVYSASLTKAPEHTERILKSAIHIMDWLFTESSLPREMHSLKSRAYTCCYRYFARERLIHKQSKIARNLLNLAFQNPNISWIDWLQQCFPLLIRSVFPSYFNALLIHVRDEMKAKYYRFKVQNSRPTSIHTYIINERAL